MSFFLLCRCRNSQPCCCCCWRCPLWVADPGLVDQGVPTLWVTNQEVADLSKGHQGVTDLGGADQGVGCPVGGDQGVAELWPGGRVVADLWPGGRVVARGGRVVGRGDGGGRGWDSQPRTAGCPRCHSQFSIPHSNLNQIYMLMFCRLRFDCMCLDIIILDYRY